MNSETRLKIVDGEAGGSRVDGDKRLLEVLLSDRAFADAHENAVDTRRRIHRHLRRLMLDTQRIMANYDHADPAIDRRLDRMSAELRALWGLVDACLESDMQEIVVAAVKGRAGSEGEPRDCRSAG